MTQELIQVPFYKGYNPSMLACLNYYTALERLWRDGRLTSPRGQLVRELLGVQLVFSGRSRFLTFPQRKLNMDYIKREMLWYLRGNRFDDSICDHAKIWKDIKSPDGGIESNYGQYLFPRDHETGKILENSGISRVVNTLLGDKDSRRAAVMILGNRHLDQLELKDYPCTCSLNFHIRDGRLMMHVHMRSQDAVFGLGNDLPFFSFVHEMVANLFNSRALIEDGHIVVGELYLTADSWHVYERHFSMVNDILENPVAVELDCPFMAPGEAEHLLSPEFDDKSYLIEEAGQTEIQRLADAEEFDFSAWLLGLKAKE